jgi:hypothetical protein
MPSRNVTLTVSARIRLLMRPSTTWAGVMLRVIANLPASSWDARSFICASYRKARWLAMIPALPRRGARVAGVSPASTTNSTSVEFALAGVVSAAPRSSRTRSATKPMRRAPGFPSVHGTTTMRSTGRATVAMISSTTSAMTARNSTNRTRPPSPRRSP